MKQDCCVLLLAASFLLTSDVTLAFTTSRQSCALTNPLAPTSVRLPVVLTSANMSTESAIDPASLKKTDIDVEEVVPSTMPEAIHRFFLGPDHGPIAVVITLISMTAWRLSLASLGPLDAGVFGVLVVFWWFQEHFLHDRLLHSEWDWYGKEIHQGHHKRPYFHISIDPAGLMMAWLLTASLLLRCCLPLPLALSASIGYASAGLVYEWAHYIAHTRVKPPNQFWKRVRDHHIRHHMVNNNYWFSFTIPGIDSLFGTNPSVSDARASVRVENSDQR